MEMNLCTKCGGTGKVPGKVGAEMKLKRRKALLSQKEVAGQMGIEVAILSRLEHDKNPWTKQRVEDFKAALVALQNGASNVK